MPRSAITVAATAFFGRLETAQSQPSAATISSQRFWDHTSAQIDEPLRITLTDEFVPCDGGAEGKPEIERRSGEGIGLPQSYC
jgi:hypothetical protein